MKRLMSGFFLCIVCLTAVCAQAASSEQLAENILESLNMPAITGKMVGKMIELELKSSKDSRAYADLIRKFSRQYLNWENLKTPMIKSYTETFSNQELAEIDRFFSSPAGKKFIEKSPELKKKMVNLVQQKILSYQPQLQDMIIDDELKKMKN